MVRRQKPQQAKPDDNDDDRLEVDTNPDATIEFDFKNRTGKVSIPGWFGKASTGVALLFFAFAAILLTLAALAKAVNFDFADFFGIVIAWAWLGLYFFHWSP